MKYHRIIFRYTFAISVTHIQDSVRLLNKFFNRMFRLNLCMIQPYPVDRLFSINTITQTEMNGGELRWKYQEQEPHPSDFIPFLWQRISSCLTQVMPSFRISLLCPTLYSGNFRAFLKSRLKARPMIERLSNAILITKILSKVELFKVINCQ